MLGSTGIMVVFNKLVEKFEEDTKLRIVTHIFNLENGYLRNLFSPDAFKA